MALFLNYCFQATCCYIYNSYPEMQFKNSHSAVNTDFNKVQAGW